MVQNFDILGLKSFFFLSTPLKILKKGISSCIYLVLAIIDLEMVMKMFLSPENLSGAQTLFIHELLNIVMVDKHKNFMLRPI